MLAEADLEQKPSAVVRTDGRQILIVRTEDGISAFPNRCPHEGYPLSEGDICNGRLRCNWHNWTFDLGTGEAIVGGDDLRLMPTRIENGRIFVRVEPPDRDVERKAALRGIEEALSDADQQRLVRETARLTRFGADPLDAVRVAIAWVAERLERGTTHAIAGAPDWIALSSTADVTPAEKLAAIGEVLGHIADDGRRESRFAFPRESRPWNEIAFAAAIERQDEVDAMARLRGAFQAGITLAELMPTFERAALTHYADFGHSLIYTVKTRELAEILGPSSVEALLLLLTRSLVFATREDLLPEFRTYGEEITRWGVATRDCDFSESLGGSPRSAMSIVRAWSASFEPEIILRRLIDLAARLLLRVDDVQFSSVDAKIGDNIGWLDFTHSLTFAEAGARVATESPRLWPAVLLQLACFIGRNARYADFQRDAQLIDEAEAERFFSDPARFLIDHGRERFIVSVHLIKTFYAGRRLVEWGRVDKSLIATAIHRYMTAPTKGRHVLRNARQMFDLLSSE